MGLVADQLGLVGGQVVQVADVVKGQAPIFRDGNVWVTRLDDSAGNMQESGGRERENRGATMSSLVAFATPTIREPDWLHSVPLRRRAAVCVVALVALFAPGRAPGLPGSARSAAVGPELGRSDPAGIDVDRVIETVEHHVRAHPSGRATLVARDDAYVASFDGRGFALSLGDRDLGVSLQGLSRGGDTIPLRAGAWTGDGNVARRTVGAGLVEQVTARDGLIEWDVVLAAPPPGGGPLRVEAALAGVRDVTPSEDSLTLTLEGGGRARMGELVVKDATGATLHRSLPTVDGSILRLEVPEAVLDEATYPLTLDPTLGPEMPVTGPLPAPDAQSLPAIAFDGANSLVVWQTTLDDGLDVFFSVDGARVAADGTVLDTQGIRIAFSVNPTNPAVAFDGTNYLVVWSDARDGTNDIYAARVGTDGTLLDGGGIPISTAANAQEAPAVAFDGTNYLITWTDGRNGANDIYAARLSPAGTLVDGPADTGGIPISTAANNQGSPAVAFDGTNHLVTWTDGRSGTNDVYAARVSPAGTLVDGPAATGGIAISTAANTQGSPALAFDGTNYLVTWTDLRSGGNDVFGARVSTAGSVLDGPPATGGIAISTAASAQQLPALAFDGTNYLVVWRDNRSGSFDIVGARVSTAGSVLDGPPVTGGIVISTAVNPQQFPAVAFDGTNHLVAWGDSRSVTDDVYGARITTGGTLLDGPPDTGGIILSTGASHQGPSAVAFDGTNYFVVWRDYRGLGSGRLFPVGDVIATRVTPAGEILDPAGIVLALSASPAWNIFRPRPIRAPGLAFDGTNYLVTWSEVVGSDSRVFGARVNPAGQVLDPTPIDTELATDETTVAFNGTNYLVVGFFNQFSGVHARLVSPAGTPLGNTFAVSTSAPDPNIFRRGQQVAASSDGSNFFVVWRDQRAGSDDIYGARISATGTLLDGPTDTGGIPIATASGHQSEPSVAFDGTRYLVAWQGAGIYGARVGTDGTLLDGPPDTGAIPISTPFSEQSLPAVGANGAFLVVWRDRRSGVDEIYGTRVKGTDGTLQDPSGFLIGAGGAGHEGFFGVDRPAVAKGQGNRWAVSYGRTDPAYGGVRLYVRTVAPK